MIVSIVQRVDKKISRWLSFSDITPLSSLTFLNGYGWLMAMLYYWLASTVFILFEHQLPEFIQYHGFSVILILGLVLTLAIFRLPWSLLNNKHISFPRLFSKILVIGAIPNLFLLSVGLLLVIFSYNRSIEQVPIVLPSLHTIIRLLILAPISEELFFRFIVYRSLKVKLGWFGAAYVNALLFSLAHVTMTLTDLVKGIITLQVGLPIGPFLLGLLTAYLYEKSNSIALVIGVHSLFNLTAPLMSITFPFVLDFLQILY